jgi:hypothetical protein
MNIQTLMKIANSNNPRVMVDLANELIKVTLKKQCYVKLLWDMRTAHRLYLTTFRSARMGGLTYPGAGVKANTAIKKLLGTDSNFHKCRIGWKEAKTELKFQQIKMDHMLKLMQAPIPSVLRYMECCNARETDYSLSNVGFIHQMSNVVVAEILAWKLLQHTAQKQ